jgi:hypothetical protein
VCNQGINPRRYKQVPVVWSYERRLGLNPQGEAGEAAALLELAALAIPGSPPPRAPGGLGAAREAGGQAARPAWREVRGGLQPLVQALAVRALCPHRQRSDLTPTFIGMRRNAPLPPMKEGARVHHSYGSYAPSTYGSYEPRRPNPSTAHRSRSRGAGRWS